MTTVLFYKEKLYADTLATRVGDGSKSTVTKLFRHKNSIYGICGVYQHRQLFESSLRWFPRFQIIDKAWLSTPGYELTFHKFNRTRIMEWNGQDVNVYDLQLTRFSWFKRLLMYRWKSPRQYTSNGWVIMGSGQNITHNALKSTNNPITAIQMASMIDGGTNSRVESMGLNNRIVFKKKG